MKRSFEVIGSSKKLLLFPIVTGTLTLLIALFFLAPITLRNTGHGLTEAAHWEAVASAWGTWDSQTKQFAFNPSGYAALAGMYLIGMFLATFFNVAFFHEILNALDGRPVSVRGGLRFAVTRLKPILAWSLMTGLVGLIIKSLEERAGVVGRWVMKLVGIAWSVASVFVVPIIVREEKRANPVRMLKSSAGLLKKTWGESLIGYVGLQAVGQVIAFATLILFIAVGGLLAYSLQSLWVAFAALGLWVVWVIVLAYFIHVASQVFVGALFIYAAEGVVPGPFDREQMEMAWKVKAGRPSR